ncbi:hypothetical protein [Henriciella sp.]|uniref:hypothetical protein n=1 Tax=Henriciella sp. TaxID=1968823 RepID=UPI00260DD968|nr:hypothetical protein [Henriciella sp.]
MTTDARAKEAYSKGLSLLIDGLRQIRIGVEIDRIMDRANCEPDGAGTDAPPGSRVHHFRGDRTHANGG